MKRGKIYLGILIAILILAQFIQMLKGSSFFFGHSIASMGAHSKVFVGKNQLLYNDWINPLKKDGQLYALKNDLYLLKDTIQRTVQMLEVLATSPPTKDSIRCQTTYLTYEHYAHINLMEFSNNQTWEDSLAIKHLKIELLAKKDLLQAVKDAHSVRAMVGMVAQEVELDWFTLLFFSPYFGPLMLLLFLLVFWGIDKLSSYLATYFERPKWIVLILPFLVFILWDTFRLSELHYSNLQAKGLPWTHWLSAQILVSLFFIPSFVWFFYFKERFFDKWDVVDGEAGKFIYIFITLTIGNYVHGYLDAQMFYYLNPQTTATRIWQTGQVPAFALLFATANFLNNFRKRYYHLKAKEKALGIAQKSDLESQATLATLQSKVNPHFLYNALNSIASLSKDDPDKTEKMTLALSKFYKYSSNREDKLWSTIEEELSLIKSYLAIEKIRFGEQLSLSINCEASLKPQPIPHFLLQPLVENAIKYGYSEQEEKVVVTIGLKRKADKVIIEIIDTGTPFSEEMQLGYGLKSVQQKLKLLYPEKHQIDFINFPQKKIVITLSGL